MGLVGLNKLLRNVLIEPEWAACQRGAGIKKSLVLENDQPMVQGWNCLQLIVITLVNRHRKMSLESQQKLDQHRKPDNK